MRKKSSYTKKQFVWFNVCIRAKEEDREGYRERVREKVRQKDRERSILFGGGSINGQSRRGGVRFMLKFDELFLKSWNLVISVRYSFFVRYRRTFVVKNNLKDLRFLHWITDGVVSWIVSYQTILGTIHNSPTILNINIL